VTLDDPESLPAERTELAWVRTTLACGALAAIAARLGDDAASRWLALALAGLVTAPGLVACLLRVRVLRAQPQPGAAPAASVALLAASVALAGLAALVLMLA
jgi:hypothetical protein